MAAHWLTSANQENAPLDNFNQTESSPPSGSRLGPTIKKRLTQWGQPENNETRTDLNPLPISRRLTEIRIFSQALILDRIKSCLGSIPTSFAVIHWQIVLLARAPHLFTPSQTFAQWLICERLLLTVAGPLRLRPDSLLCFRICQPYEIV